MTTSAGVPPGSRQDRKVDVRVELSSAFPSSSMPLPVTIREASTRMVAEGVVGQTLSVAPGAYFVVAQLPDGETHIEHVQVAATTSVLRLSQPEGFAASDNRASAGKGQAEASSYPTRAQRDMQHDDSDVRPLAGLATLANAPGEDTSAQFARRYRAVRSDVQPFALDKVRSRNAGHIVQLSPSGEIVERAAAVKLRYEDDSLGCVKVDGANRAGRFALFDKGTVSKTHAVAVAIPADNSSSVEFFIPEKEDRLLIAILNNKDANSLLSYLVQQSYDRIADYSEDSETEFRNLLRSKMRDPIGAVIGGYGLLSLNRLSPLDQWSQNLPTAAPWLPDSFVIHGETHARLGKHDIAARAFHELSKCGIPIFSLGLSYAESRVRLYVRHGLPDKDSANEMAVWLNGLCLNVIKRLKVGEVLTTIIDPKTASPNK